MIPYRTQLIMKLDQHFLPKKNKDYARFKLGNLVQQDDEPMVTYYSRIREIAKKCNYADENDAIRDYLIKTMRNNIITVTKKNKKNGDNKKFRRGEPYQRSKYNQNQDCEKLAYRKKGKPNVETTEEKLFKR